MSSVRLFTALLASGLFSLTAAAQAQEQGPGRHIDPAAMHREFCTDHLARKAGHLAYTAAKLNLTADQKSLWDAYYKAVISSARLEEQQCLQSPPPSPGVHPTILERQSRAVQKLQARLQGIQSAQPALTVLYQSLTAEQKAKLDEHQHHGFGHHHEFGDKGGHFGGQWGNHESH